MNARLLTASCLTGVLVSVLGCTTPPVAHRLRRALRAEQTATPAKNTSKDVSITRVRTLEWLSRGTSDVEPASVRRDPSIEEMYADDFPQTYKVVGFSAQSVEDSVQYPDKKHRWTWVKDRPDDDWALFEHTYGK